MTIRNIMGGFKVCSIFPFNRDAIRPPLQSVPKEMESLAKRSGLAYIPLYSPAKERTGYGEFSSGDSHIFSGSSQSCLSSDQYSHSPPCIAASHRHSSCITSLLSPLSST